MLGFKIQINNGVLVNINTPIDFDKTEFNLTRSKDLHSVTSSFAGNKASFVFQKDIHNNVFNEIINEYDTKGFNADVKLFIYWNNTLIFDGKFDFVECETDMINEIKCQVVKKDKLFYLDKNKSVDVDIFSELDLNKNAVNKVDSELLFIDSGFIAKQSIWEDNNIIHRVALAGRRSFNHIRNQTIDDVNESLNWLKMSNRIDEYEGYLQQLVSAKENLSNIKINVFYSNDSTATQFLTNSNEFQLRLYYGEEIRPNESYESWVQRITFVPIKTMSLIENIPSSLGVDFNIDIPNIPRGGGIWLFWVCSGELEFNIKQSKVTITANSSTYASNFKAVKYKDLVANVVKKTADIDYVQWNVNYYDETYAFNGNLLRQLYDKPFNVKWDNVKKQLNERNLGCYYDEEINTLIIDHRNNILGTNKIQNVGDLAKLNEYNVSEDDYFVINKFVYKYNKYQAQKEIPIEGNMATIHGESEWFVNNQGYEGTINVDLPFIRDSIMIEDLRRQSIEVKDDTATNEDDTVVLIEATPFNQSFIFTENMILDASFEGSQQSFKNDGSFSWVKIGVTNAGVVFINDSINYSVISATDTLLILERNTASTDEFNGINNYKFAYVVNRGVRSTIINGMLNEAFSVRQNIEYWKQTLQACNYYNNIPIINTLYKENKNAVVNGLREIADIIPSGGLHSSRFIKTKVVIGVNDYFNLVTNRIGYISVYNSKNELINIYITDLEATFVDGCERMEASIKGWLKI